MTLSNRRPALPPEMREEVDLVVGDTMREVVIVCQPCDDGTIDPDIFRAFEHAGYDEDGEIVCGAPVPWSVVVESLDTSSEHVFPPHFLARRTRAEAVRDHFVEQFAIRYTEEVAWPAASRDICEDRGGSWFGGVW